jgi:hypothetical protein
MWGHFRIPQATGKPEIAPDLVHETQLAFRLHPPTHQRPTPQEPVTADGHANAAARCKDGLLLAKLNRPCGFDSRRVCNSEGG